MARMPMERGYCYFQKSLDDGYDLKVAVTNGKCSFWQEMYANTI